MGIPVTGKLVTTLDSPAGLVIPPLPTNTPLPGNVVCVGNDEPVEAVENADETKTDDDVDEEEEAEGPKSNTVAKSPTLPVLFPATAATLLEEFAEFG